MHDRRDIMRFGIGAGVAIGAAGLAGCASTRIESAAASSLLFDRGAFTELIATIGTDAGDRTVVYRFYKAIPYVARPVDTAYQSLNVSVPVSIDGKPVDAADAPILFSNSVGGYMPSSVTAAAGIGAAGTGGPMRGMAGGTMEVGSGGNAMVSHGRMVSNAKLALAAGFVVVEPGARGRTLVDAQGRYYGAAPAAIVDLKAAVRYVRANKGRIPGNTDRIVSSGTSAGGALSALLGASGDSPLYTPHLEALGAAEASDAVFAAGCWCPITDLDHADAAYEWNWGGNVMSSGEQVDQALSAALAKTFADYQVGLGLHGKDGFGPITAATYDDYLLRTYLQPAAARYLSALSDAELAAYLLKNRFIQWSNGEARFGWADFLAHVGARKKNLPAFDAFDLSTGENNLFGLGTTRARHFRPFSLRHATGDLSASIDADLPETLRLMNPMPFIAAGNPGRAQRWWIRVGAKDSDTSLTVVANLAAALENRGADVNARMYWDAGHGANEDAAAFVEWIGALAA